MRITIIANEIPYPPRHGGQVDVWRRVSALRREGVAVQLIAWGTDQEILEAEGSRPLHESIELFLLRKGTGLPSTLLRLLRVLRYPSHVAARVVNKTQLQAADQAVQRFGPAVIMVEGLFGWLLGQELADKMQTPLVARSQNIEHKYVSVLRSKADGLRKKLTFSLALAHLESFEKAALRRADRFYDISFSDLAEWQKMGFSNGECLPPFVEPMRWEKGLNPQYDVGFMGNLYTPNNVEGVLWLISRVVPLLDPSSRVLIAGSKPVEAVVAACAANRQITLLPNPVEVADVYSTCKSLVNPVMGGSGVNMKALEMLQTSLPVISSPQGVAGLPSDVISFFELAATPIEFAESIRRALTVAHVDIRGREVILDKYFGRSAVVRFVESLQSVVERRKDVLRAQRI